MKSGSIQHVVHAFYWSDQSGDPSYRVEICRQAIASGEVEFTARMFLLSGFEAYIPGQDGVSDRTLASMQVFEPVAAFPPRLHGKAYASRDACISDVIEALEAHFSGS